jgi:phosphate transport system substrate-binding protein
MWFIGMLLLPEFLGRAGQWLTNVICVASLVICWLLLWKPFQPRARNALVLGVAVVAVVLSAGIAGSEIYGNSVAEAPGEEIRLTEYEPFREGTLAKSLAEPSALKIMEDLPRLDGATALYPLYSSFVRATYPEADYDAYGVLHIENDDEAVSDKMEMEMEIKMEMEMTSPVICSRTSNAFTNLLDGYADVIFLMGLSDEQQLMAKQRGLELKLTPIGKEAFVFFVNKRNSVSNLTAADIRRIYSGEITNWSEAGGSNNDIRAYQRPKNSGSQTALRQVMGTVPLASAPKEEVYDFMSGMYQAVANYKNYKNSLGYSFLFYINGMIAENEVKLLSVDGIAPTSENIAGDGYPFADNFYAVTAEREPRTDEEKRRAANVNKLIEWILSPQGQFLVKATGYVPLPVQ